MSDFEDKNSQIQTISRLQNDYNSLKLQYEKAMTYVQQIDDLHRKNGDLQRENALLKSNHDELSHRLELSLQLNNELKDKLKTQNEKISTVVDSGVNEKDIKERAEHVRRLKDQLDEKKKIVKCLREENENYKNAVSSLIETAKRKCSINFTSVQQIEDFILKNNFASNNNNCCNDNNNTNNNEVAKNVMKEKMFKLQIKKLRQKVRKDKEIRPKLIARIRELEARVRFADNSDNMLASQRSQFEKQMKDITMSFESQLAAKDSQILTLQSRIKEQKILVMPPSRVNVDYEKLNPLADELCDVKAKLQTQKHKYKESKITLESSQKKILELTDTLKITEATNIDNKKRADSAEMRNRELESKMNENETELNSLRIEVEELKTQLHFNESQTRAEQLNASKRDSTIEEMTVSMSNMKLEITSLQVQIDKQKKELATLYSERKSLVALLHRQSELLNSFEQQLMIADSQKKSLTKQLEIEKSSKTICSQPNDLIQKTLLTQQNPQNQKSEPKIPINVWTSLDLPHDLMQNIVEFVKIESTPVSTKIQKVLNLVSSYFEEQLGMLAEKCKFDKKESKRQADFFRKFSQDVIQIVDVLSSKSTCTSLSREIDDRLFKEVIERIKQMKQNSNDLLYENKRLSDLINNLIQKLNTDNVPNAINQIESLQTTVRESKTKIHFLLSKRHKLQKVIQEISHKFASSKVHFQDQLKKLQHDNQLLKSQITEFENSLKIVTNENDKIKMDLDMTKMNHNEEMQSNDEKYQSEIKELSERKDKEIQELASHVNKLQEKNQNMLNKLNDANREIEQLKRTLQLLKSSRDTLNKQISESSKQFEDTQKDILLKFDQEKASIHSSYSNVLAQLKNKNATLRKLLDSTSESLAESESKNKDLISLNTQICAEKRQALVNLEAQKNEIKREKQLIDTKIRAAQLANDIKCQRITDEMNTKFEAQKRQIYAKVAHEFSRYFDANQILDDDQFCKLISTVSAEMNRLLHQENALSELLNTNGKNLEDAVANLLYSVYQ